MSINELWYLAQFCHGALCAYAVIYGLQGR